MYTDSVVTLDYSAMPSPSLSVVAAPVIANFAAVGMTQRLRRLA